MSVTSPVKVVLVSNAPAPYRVPMLRELAARADIELTVIYCTKAHIDNSLGEAAHHPAHVIFLKGRYWAMARRFMHYDVGVWQALNDISPDVVITIGYIPTFLFAFIWSWLRGVPHIAKTDGTFESERGLTWLHKLLRRVVLGNSAAGVGACEGSIDIFRAYGMPEWRLFKSPLAVRNEAFFEAKASDGPVDLLFCGRFVPHKRPDFALALADELSRRLGRRLTLDFVGAGPEESALKAQAERMHERVTVRFLGYATQQELPGRYAAARIFLFPSEWDPWGVVANEACAAGVPVIVSPMAGSAHELIRDGENGFVRALDLAAWADVAETLLKDEALRLRMGARGRELVRDFSFATAAEGMFRAIRCAVAPTAIKPVVIASLMRAEGTTGVQTHVNAVRAYFDSAKQPWYLVTPFDTRGPWLYLLIATRKLLERVSPERAVALYRGGHAWLLGRALKTRLRKVGPCVIYAQCPVSAEVALAVRQPEQTVCMVVHFNESQADEWVGKGMLKPGGAGFLAIRSLEQRILPRLDGVVFVSDWMRRTLLTRMPALAQVSQAVIPNFVADPGVAQAEPEGDLVAIGTLEPRKNQRYLLEILAAARATGQDVSLTLIGDGPDRAMLERHARELGVADLVHFAGFVKDGARRMTTHRAVIHAALLENLPLTLIEALSRGRPVFAGAVGGIPEVFRDGVEGRTLPLDNAARAAGILCKALRDPQTMARMGQAARQAFLSSFERRVVGQRLCDFLTQCPPAQRRPRVVMVQRRIMHYRVPMYERLREALAQQGIDFQLAYTAAPLKRVAANRDEGPLDWATPVAGGEVLGGLLSWQDLRPVLKGADLVILMQENRMLFNYLVPWLYPRMKWAFFGHGKNFQATGLLKLGELFKRWYLGFADWWFAYTALSARVVAGAGVAAERVTVLNNAIDNAALQADLDSFTDAEIMACRTAWGVGEGPVGLVLGSLYAPKRLAFAFAAARKIRLRVPDFQLLIVGDGPERELVRRMAQAHPDWIHWAGAQTGRDKALALRMASVLLNPGMVGLTVLDSLIAGCPMVTCELKIHSPEIEYLHDGRNGLITPNNVDAYAGQVVDLLSQPERLERMAQAGREDARKLTLDAMVSNFASGIVTCLDKERRRE